MTTLDLILTAALLGAGLVSRREALLNPPAEMLQNIDFLDDMPLIEGAMEAP